MPTKREIGYRLYGRQSKQRTSVSSASRVGATTEASSQVRYGFAQADSADGKVPVKLDNSDSVVTCTCDSIIKQGDRVKVIVTESGQLIALPIGNNLVDYVDKVKEDLAQQIIDKGTEIMESVSEDIAEVNEAVAAAEEKADGLAADLQVTNTTITALSTRVDGVAEDATAAMTAASSAQQDLNGFKQTVEQHYQTKDAAADAMAQEVLDRDSAIEQSATQIRQAVSQYYQSKTEAGAMEQELQSQITQNADSISTEVTNRTKAVNDALQESKTYTETYAGGIKTELEGEFQNELGSYYSKTEINEKFDGVQTTITAAVSDAASAKELAEATEAVADEAKELAEKNGLDDAIPEYAKSSSNTTAPSSGWSTSLPSYSKGSYTWLRYRMVAKDGSVSYSTPQRFEAADEAMLVSTYFNESTNGLDIGQYGKDNFARVASTGAFEVWDGSVCSSRLGTNLIELGRNSKGARVAMCGNTGFIDSGESYKVSGTIETDGMALHSEGGILLANGSEDAVGSADQWVALREDGVLNAYLSGVVWNIPITGIGRRSGEMNDWVTDQGVGDIRSGSRVVGSGNWRTYASGYREMVGNVQMSFGAGRSDMAISFPTYFAFNSYTDYSVTLQLLGTADGSASDFNNIQVIPVSMKSNGFTIHAWNTTSNSRSYRVAMHVAGWNK